MQKFLANLNLFIRKSSESKNHMNIFDEQKNRIYKKLSKFDDWYILDD